MKRVMIAGTHGGCGKSDIISGILQALRDRDIEVTAFKNGPSYTDPIFYRRVLNIKSYNLDTYLMTKNTVNYLLDKSGSEVSILAGNLGFYDGYSFTPTASSCELSLWTNTPVILVVNCSGRGVSIGAVMKGYMEYAKNNIVGIIFSDIRGSIYPLMKQECEKLGLKAFGYFPKVEDKAPVSRHLSFATELELEDMRARVKKLAKIAEETIDIDEILETAASAPDIHYDFNEPEKIADVKIAYAYDNAFSFYYENNLELLRNLGAELIKFSPIEDEKLPEEIDGLYLGDGYMPLHAKRLSENESMLKSIKEAVDNGLPTIAEGGGYMYLHKSFQDYTTAEYPMVGVVDGKCMINNNTPGYFYVTLKALEDNMLCDKGEKIASYEQRTHHSTSSGGSFEAERAGWSTRCINASKNLYAGFPHIHFYSNIDFAKNFIKACAKRNIKNI